MRQLTVCLGLGLLSACGGGGGALETATILNEEVGLEILPAASGPLSSTIESVGVDFPGVPSLLEDPTTRIKIETDYTVRISTDAGEFVSFAPADEVASIAGGIRTFANAGGTNALLFNKPFSSPDPSSFGRGLDYVAYGVWLTGAATDILSSSEPYEIEDAGVLVVGNGTDPASLPLSGTAQYDGDAVAILADCLTVEDILNGFVQVNVDFGLREVDTVVALDRSDGSLWGVITSNTATIPAGAAQFDALDSTADNGMTGHVHGFFAGPVAEEIAGQFHLEEADTERRVIGSFGALDSSSSL